MNEFLIFAKNHRIGCRLQLFLILWLLWRPIHCNNSRPNGGNRRTKSSEQRLNQNWFDPSNRHYNRTDSLYADQQNLNYNYLLSVLQSEERQAILDNVIHQKSDPTPGEGFDGEVPENTESVPEQSDNDLSAEDRADLQETNKLFSPSLNVIDVSPQDTQLAHSVLLIHKPKPNKSTVKPTIAPQLLFPQTITGTGVKSPIVTAIKMPTTHVRTPSTTTTTTESYPTPVRNNHRPMFLRPFPGKRSTTTTPPTTFAVKSTTSSTSIYSTNSVTNSQTTNTTATASDDSDDEIPIVISSNHNRKQSFPFWDQFTRQKLTSTEYAIIYTTPELSTESEKSVFTEVPTMASVQTITGGPTYTFRPPYVTTISHKRPTGMKIMTVNANRIRQPEEIYHEGITVLDPPFLSNHPNKLPPNTTIIHKNLIVPMKDGRPKPVYPMSSTTQFPVYPIVAGITKWHTASTPQWILPMVTTTAPEHVMTSALTTTETTSSDSPMTAESVNRPVVVTGHPLHSMSTQHTPPHSSQLVTVTPVKTSHPTHSSSTFLVTSHSSPRPSTSTQGYVNAIWAPPMPNVPMTRPVQGVQASQSSWWSPISNVFSVESGHGSMFSMMNVMRTVFFTILVFFLPPMTLAAAVLQTAWG